MPFCTNCGNKLELRFCWRCGAPHIEADAELVAEAANTLRSRFIGQYEELDQQVRAAFNDARFALLEAIGSCEDGHLLASAVMSRTALEAVLYLARIQVKDNDGNPLIEGAVARILPDTLFPWGQLKKWAKANGLLDNKHVAKCDEVRQIGNFAAHHAEQVTRNLVGTGGASYQVWVSADDAYWALDVVREIVLIVAVMWNKIR